MSSLQESSFNINSGGGGGARSWSNADKVHITVISASEMKNQATLCRVMFPIYRNLLLIEPYCEGFVKRLLGIMVDIPQTFFDGHDCDMVQKLSRMLHHSILEQHLGVDHFVMFVVASKDSCWYNVVNTTCFSNGDEQFPSSEFVGSLARESGLFSLPAGARTIERLKVQDDHKEDKCAICLQVFSSYYGEVAKLPCSHIYHYNCILEWFVQKSTCPLCRFPCSKA